MALTFSVDIDGLSAGAGLAANIIQKAIPIFLDKVAYELQLEIARHMPYNRRAGRRPRPPFSKTGRAVKSLRTKRVGRGIQILGTDYLADLQDAGWDVVTPSWNAVRPRLQKLFNDAIREAQR